MRLLARVTSLLGLCSALATSTAAQSPAAPDSSAAPAQRPRSLLDVARDSADSLRASGADITDTNLVRLEKSGFVNWLDSWERTLGFSWQSNYDQVTGSVEASGNFALDRGQVSSHYNRSETEHRQQDRDASQSNFTGTWNAHLGEVTKLNLAMGRRTLEDVTRTGTSQDITISNETNNVNLGLSGATKLGGDFDFRWGAGGEVHSDEISNRGNRVANDLAGGSGSARWIYRAGSPASVSARFGYDRVAGDGTLRDETNHATTTQDTVGAKLDLRNARGALVLDIARASFVEERLDWRKNSSGQVDTTMVPAGEEILGEEREQRERDSFTVGGDYQLLPIVNLRSNFDRSYEERSFLFSDQGIVLDSRNDWQNTLRVDYFEGSFVQLDYKFRRNWIDRRTVDDEEFRGKEIRQTEEVSAKLEQPLFLTTKLELKGQQLLEQEIYEDVQSQGDRDRFTERIDAILSAEPFASLNLTTSGHLSRLDDINIRTERVGNNKEERLYEVRGGYTWKPNLRLIIDQVYRMQIVFRDYHLSDDRDEFNKQGQFSTKLKYSRPPKSSTGTGLGSVIAKPSPSIELGHSVNFRENGRRAITEIPRPDEYVTTQRRYTNVFTGAVTIPISIWSVRVSGERGVLDDEVTARGPQTEEDGRLEMQLKGERSFRMGLIHVSVDAQRVLAYGPRVRPENEDFWVANSTVTVRF